MAIPQMWKNDNILELHGKIPHLFYDIFEKQYMIIFKENFLRHVRKERVNTTTNRILKMLPISYGTLYNNVNSMLLHCIKLPIMSLAF